MKAELYTRIIVVHTAKCTTPIASSGGGRLSKSRMIVLDSAVLVVTIFYAHFARFLHAERAALHSVYKEIEPSPIQPTVRRRENGRSWADRIARSHWHCGTKLRLS